MTERQKEVYDAIVALMLEKGYPPSVREIGNRIGLRSTCTICKHLTALAKKGYISYIDSTPRTITVNGIRYVDERDKV